MCGIAGFLTAQPRHSGSELKAQVRSMTAELGHRGPDSQGEWTNPSAGVALGHTRLAILDLSPCGHQPMLSSCGRYVLVYNGEIYNFRELRTRLESAGCRFRGHSDTEVLLEAIAHWGIDQTLTQLNGMFAFALWMTDSSRLLLARDRLGQKPLYGGWLGETFFFASELGALRAHPRFNAAVDPSAAALFLRHACVPAPYTILRGIHKIGAGEITEVIPASREVRTRSYWSLRQTAEHGVRNTVTGNAEEVTDRLEDLVSAAVQRRMVADVPLGAFLSGGIDSTLVVALMQHYNSQSTQTFSIGYEEERFNEAPFARAVAEKLGTNHRELIVTAKDALAIIPELPRIYDEPFADVSQLPTLLVCRMAREHVTVALSGDGGDEFFCGYDRYFNALRRWNRRSAAGRVPRDFIRGLSRTASALFPLSPALARVARLSAAASPEELFAARSERLHNATALIPQATPCATVYTDKQRWASLSNPLETMMFLDSAAWLQDDILVKVDRASMSTSLEVRNPLLDAEVIEYAWRIPLHLKVADNGERKHLLKQLLRRHIPTELIDRPKKGFAVPLADWLKTPLRDWAESLLTRDRIQAQGILDPRAVRRVWQSFLRSGKHRLAVWNLLMLQAWTEAWQSNDKGRTP